MNIRHTSIERAYKLADELLQLICKKERLVSQEELCGRLRGYLQIWLELSEAEEEAKKHA